VSLYVALFWSAFCSNSGFHAILRTELLLLLVKSDISSRELAICSINLVHENTRSGPGMIPADVFSLDLRVRVLGASLDIRFIVKTDPATCVANSVSSCCLCCSRSLGAIAYRNEEYECNGNDRYEEPSSALEDGAMIGDNVLLDGMNGRRWHMTSPTRFLDIQHTVICCCGDRISNFIK
jgi:hypothetical protein